MKHIGINDFAYYNYPTCMSVSPDGKHGVIPVVNVNMEDNCYDSCLWVMDMENGEYKKLTNGKMREILSGLTARLYSSFLTVKSLMQKRSKMVKIGHASIRSM